MKMLVMLAVLTSSLTASAIIVNPSNATLTCRDPWVSDTAFSFSTCLLTTTTLPTWIVSADYEEMSVNDKVDFLRAEADNFLLGVDGDYLLLKGLAKENNVSPKTLALRLVQD